MRGHHDIETLLPLTPNTYHVLLALGVERMHGYAIIQAFEAMTGGRETLLPGSLYATLARMAEQALVEEVEAPSHDASGGPARRYYRSTARGRAAARAESVRRTRLLEYARTQGLAGDVR